MSADVNVPKLGQTNKTAVYGVVGAGAAYVIYRYYRSRKAASDAAAAPTDPGYADPGTLPAVDTSGTGYGQYGYPASGNTTQPNVASYGFSGTTDDQWSQYAAGQLVQSDTWSYTDIVSALGNYLGGRALTTMQAQIVQAAIAIAGYPPVGTHPIISGGDTGGLVAPSGLRSTSVAGTSVALAWNSVPGASGYHMFRNGAAVGDTGSTSGTVTGLTGGQTYQFTVAAYNVAGVSGPQSAAVSVTTPGASTPAPTPTPKPTPKPGPPPSHRYPTRKDWHTVLPGESYSAIAQHTGTGLSGQALYDYQFTSQAGHSAAAAATLRRQTARVLHTGQSVAIPYPR